MLFAAVAAVHWAGPIAGGSDESTLLLLLIYVLLASSLMESILLHLAISLPSAGLQRKFVPIVYLPVAMGVLTSSAILILELEQNLIFSVYFLGSLFGICAGITLIVRLLKRQVGTVDYSESLVLVGLLLVAWLPNLVTGLPFFEIGAYAGLSNLSLLIMPVILARIVITNRNAEE